MTRSKRLFREAALERLSSPEQLDQQLRVTSARGWIAVIAIWALLAAVIAWSVLGEVHTREEGQGIIVTGGGLQVVVAEGNGRLNEILVEVDDTVAEDQVVARIDKYEIEAELLELRSQLDELKSQREEHVRFDEEEQRQQEILAEEETRRLQKIIEFSDKRLKRLEVRWKIVDGLREQGNMTEIDLHKVDEEIEDASLERERAALEIDRLKAKNLEARFGRERERMKREFQIDELKGRIRVLEHRHGRESQVVSKAAGIVVEIRAAEQTAVNVGDPILLIQPAESTSQQLEAILYVSAATGKRIENGDEVHISPTTVKREEHGSMLGTVRRIFDVPTSKSAMLAVLTDEDMVDKFTREMGLVYQMEVVLEPAPPPPSDEATVSGYRWTSAAGPDVTISAGTLCTGTVTVERQRPISLVIPTIKKKLNLD